MKKGDKALVVGSYKLDVQKEVRVSSAGKRYITADSIRYDARTRYVTTYGYQGILILTPEELAVRRAVQLLGSRLRTAFAPFAKVPTSVLAPTARLLVEHGVVRNDERKEIEAAIAVLTRESANQTPAV